MKLFLVIIFIVMGIAFYFVFMEPTEPVYYVMIVPKDVSHKPEKLSKRRQDYLVIVNQTSFTYDVENDLNEFQFLIENKKIEKADLETIAREILPNDDNLKITIF